MTKFEKVAEAIAEKTYNDSDGLDVYTITKNLDGRHTHGTKYALVQVNTYSIRGYGYRTLDEAIVYFNLQELFPKKSHQKRYLSIEEYNN